MEVGDAQVEGVVKPAHDPEFIPSPDRIPRKEVYEKVWKPLELGTIALHEGRYQLKVKAVTKPGGQVMELKAVRLRKKA